MNNASEQFSPKKPIIINLTAIIILGLLFGFFFKTNWGTFYLDYRYFSNELLWLGILFIGIFWQLFFLRNSRKAFIISIIMPLLIYMGIFIYRGSNLDGETMLGLWALGKIFFLPIVLLSLVFNYLYKKGHKKLFISALFLLSIILLGIAWGTAGTYFAGFMQADNTPPQNVDKNQCWKLLLTDYSGHYDRCKNITLEERMEKYDEGTKAPITITLYFPMYQINFPDANDCGATYNPSTMRILYTSKIEDATLRQLFLHGNMMIKDYYEGITITDDKAVINFKSGALQYLGGSGCIQESYKNSIEKTLKKFNSIRTIQYSIDDNIFTD